ncbi:MAG TPA: hypothetical protein VFI31_18160 [Pirellulales bacterium]|nr:hypothetical protein [Pirellulales bacterium]
MAKSPRKSDRDLNALLAGLGDDDETVREEAMSAIRELSERREVSAEIAAAAARTFPHKSSTFKSYNYELLESLWGNQNSRLIPVIEEIYDSLQDKKDAREAALRILTEQKTPRALKACARLLCRASSKTVALGWVFIPLQNVGKAARHLFPELFDALPVVVDHGPIHQLILDLAAAGILRLNDFPEFVDSICRTIDSIMDDWWKELIGAWPKQAAKQRRCALASYELGYILDLARFVDRPRLDRSLKRAVSLPPDLGIFAAASLLARGQRVPKKELERFAAKPEHRWRLWGMLSSIHRLDAFPAAYGAQEQLAEAEMVKWLESAMEMGRLPVDVRLMAKVEAPVGRSRHAFYFFAFRYPKRGEEVGEAGPYVVGAPPTMPGHKTFSHFRKVDDMPLEDHVFDYFSTHAFRLPGETRDRSWPDRLADREPATLRHIRKCDFSNEPVRDAQLLNFGRLTWLEHLDLHATNIGDRGIEALRGLKRLRMLNLWMTKISDAAMESVATLTALTSLDVTSTKIGDTGLARLTSLKQLEVLSLGDCQGVTDASLIHLSRLPRLREVALYRTKVTSRRIKTFKKNHPQLDVIY